MLVIRGEEFEQNLVVRLIGIHLLAQFFELLGSFLAGDGTVKDVSNPPTEMVWQFQIRNLLKQLREVGLFLVREVLWSFSKRPHL